MDAQDLTDLVYNVNWFQGTECASTGDNCDSTAGCPDQEYTYKLKKNKHFKTLVEHNLL